MNNDNVIDLEAVTTLDIPPDKILNAAIKHGLTDVVVVGWNNNGELYFAGSSAVGAENLWLLAQAQRALLDV